MPRVLRQGATFLFLLFLLYLYEAKTLANLTVVSRHSMCKSGHHALRQLYLTNPGEKNAKNKTKQNKQNFPKNGGRREQERSRARGTQRLMFCKLFRVYFIVHPSSTPPQQISSGFRGPGGPFQWKRLLPQSIPIVFKITLTLGCKHCWNSHFNIVLWDLLECPEWVKHELRKQTPQKRFSFQRNTWGSWRF